MKPITNTPVMLRRPIAVIPWVITLSDRSSVTDEPLAYKLVHAPASPMVVFTIPRVSPYALTTAEDVHDDLLG